MLKDIFPHNAVDLGMIQKTGIKSIIYKYFRNVEKKLYKISDYIGCMSQANVDYVLKHNPEVVVNKAFHGLHTVKERRLGVGCIFADAPAKDPCDGAVFQQLDGSLL